MRVDYYLADPTGNITVLVESPVPETLMPNVTAALLELEPEAEQLGFLQETEAYDTALRMAGNEFCGNAAMSAAALFARKAGVTAGKAARIRAAVSGTPAEVTVVPQTDGSFTGTVDMPAAVSVLPTEDGLTAIVFPGITHFVAQKQYADAEAEALLKQLCLRENWKAAGLIQLDLLQRTMRPLVCVPDADTLFWEGSCASGTAAAGVFLATRMGASVETELSQPAGKLGVSAWPDGRVQICGHVKLSSVRTAEITE